MRLNYNIFSRENYCTLLFIIGFGLLQISETKLFAQEIEKNEIQNSVDKEYHVVKNIFYKTGTDLSEYEKERCFLDLYLPKETQNFPIIIWFHGGSMKHFSKDDSFIQAIGIGFAHYGIAVAVVNYRLSPKAKYPAYIEDAAASVAWVINHIPDYGGNSQSIFISGHSAGGYLTYMLGMDLNYLESFGIKSDQIAGLIPVSGQTFTHYTVREERGIPNPEITPIIDDASPCFHVRKDTPPVLAIYGENDNQDRKEENEYFIALLKKVGHADAEYKEIKGRDHASLITRILNPGDAFAETVLAFIKKHKMSK
jgi:acetyl esterase/lipase